MRLAGTVADQHDAATLVDYLLTVDIAAKAEQAGEKWQLWILDEDQVQAAKQVLAEFAANPLEAKYQSAAQAAEKIRRAEREKVRAAKRNMINLSGAAAHSRGRRPVTMMLLAACAVVFAMTDFGNFDTKRGVMTKLMMSGFVSTDGRPVLPEFEAGQFWRIFTPMLLHMSIMHFVFNMVWLVEFGTQIENRAGSVAFALIILATDLATNFSQFLWDGPTFGGMSGVNYGLFGFIWMKSYYEPWKGYLISQNTILLQVAWLFACMTGYLGSVANAGHVGGLAAGALIGYAPTLYRRLTRKS